MTNILLIYYVNSVNSIFLLIRVKKSFPCVLRKSCKIGDILFTLFTSAVFLKINLYIATNSDCEEFNSQLFTLHRLFTLHEKQWESFNQTSTAN